MKFGTEIIYTIIVSQTIEAVKLDNKTNFVFWEFTMKELRITDCVLCKHFNLNPDQNRYVKPSCWNKKTHLTKINVLVQEVGLV